ncbi:MAG: hypothetical protein LBM13_05575 [Candidatus Ancillula sp.]|jgi:hypothetical protein|nr:hypothetical protein [Candidatus Ancillula sp.]
MSTKDKVKDNILKVFVILFVVCNGFVLTSCGLFDNSTDLNNNSGTTNSKTGKDTGLYDVGNDPVNNNHDYSNLSPSAPDSSSNSDDEYDWGSNHCVKIPNDGDWYQCTRPDGSTYNHERYY